MTHRQRRRAEALLDEDGMKGRRCKLHPVLDLQVADNLLHLLLRDYAFHPQSPQEVWKPHAWDSMRAAMMRHA
jgi:hypothetical protein